MKGLYLAACRARHTDYDIVYQDIDPVYNCDLGGDMLDIDTRDYDFVIATPPCNWWSKLNMNRNYSNYAWKTLHLLPLTIIKLSRSRKPFIIENVINHKRFEFMGIYEICKHYNLIVRECGRHTYITNVSGFNPSGIPQHYDFKYGGELVNNDGYSQGGSNVHVVIEYWLSLIHKGE